MHNLEIWSIVFAKRMIIKKSRCIIFMVVAGYEFILAVASWHYQTYYLNSEYGLIYAM